MQKLRHLPEGSAALPLTTLTDHDHLQRIHSTKVNNSINHVIHASNVNPLPLDLREGYEYSLRFYLQLGALLYPRLKMQGVEGLLFETVFDKDSGIGAFPLLAKAFYLGLYAV